MVRGYQDQRFSRVLVIKFVSHAHRAVELTVGVNHRRDVYEMAGGVRILIFYEEHEAALVSLLEKADGGLGHLGYGGLFILVAVELEAHFLKAKESKQFTSLGAGELEFVRSVGVTLSYESGDHVVVVFPGAPRLFLREKLIPSAA